MTDLPTAQLDKTLVTRLKKALTVTNGELTEVLNDPATEVLHAVLKNLFLTQEHLLQLLQRQDIPSTLLKAISTHKLSQNQRIIAALVRHPAASPNLVKQLLHQLHLFELFNLCHLPGQCADIKMAAERCLVQRLPQEPLGNKITLARRAPSTILQALFKESHLQIIEICLDNPRLKEATLFQFLSSGNCSAASISAIARHQRWGARKNLQVAILKNPNTQQQWYQQLLPKITVVEARNLLHSVHLHPQQKKWIQDFLAQR